MTETYLYSINRVININNAPDANKATVFSTDADAIYKNLLDTSIDAQCRIVGGTWTDNLSVNNIVCHPSTQDSSDYLPTNTLNTLNVAETGNIVNINGKNVSIASVETDSTTTINGKTLTIGEDTTSSTFNGNSTVITTAGVDSTTTINGKSVNVGEDATSDTVMNIYGKSVNVGETSSVTKIHGNDTTIANTGSRTTTINGLILNTGQNTTETTINGNKSVITTSNRQASETIINGRSVAIGEIAKPDSIMNIYGNTVNIGETTTTTILSGDTTTITTAGSTSTTTINGKALLIGENVESSETTIVGKDINIGTTDTIFEGKGSTYTVNTEADGAYLKLQKNVEGSLAQIDIGSLTNTKDINLKAQNIDINATDNLSLATNSFEFNKDSQKAYFEINDADSRITIGRSQLDNTYIHGSNVYIGEPGCTTTIYGNVISYSEGSNVVTNTVTEETSAFHIHNTGTKTALTVVQDNSVSGGGYNLVEFYTQENQDRTPFRIDDVGRVGLGVETSVDLKAWLHINRNDPDISSTLPDDLLLIEDTDNDATPFIVKKEGDVGIGTDVPRYKLDVWSGTSTLNGQQNNAGNINAKGIALRDVVYIKQNHTNRIMYALGNKVYSHPAGDFVHCCVTGFTFTWNKNDIAYANSDNSGVDPFLTPDDGTFVFRMTCKLHVAGSNGQIAYRRFEIFVNPQDNGNSNPAIVTVADIFDSVHDQYDFPVEPTVIRKGPTECQLEIKWKVRDNSATPPTNSRAYLDVEFFGHENIGDIKAVPLNAYDIANNGTLTLV